MKMKLSVTGSRGLDTNVTLEKEVDVVVGCGVRFLLHNTRYSVLGEIKEIDEAGQRLFVESPQYKDWVGFDGVRDIISRDELYNSRLQNQIDHGILES
jgi:hypothetical protein